ncbi:DUF551 domain-containing protein [Klebsiella pneumoniae]|uniref:DUF551 domain-containing protein n=1 Tax=Klebsiella pneumoniae TaxID=573 RepID=UPI003D20D0E4
MTSKFSIDNRELLQRISSGEAVVGIDFGNLIVRELAAFRLAAMDSEPVAVTGNGLNVALSLTQMQIDWICNTCASIYNTRNDDVAQGYINEIRATLERLAAMDIEPVAWLAIYHGEVYDEAIGITRSVVEAQADHFGWGSALTEIIPLFRHAQPAPVVPDEKDKTVDADDHPLLWSFNEGWNACRAAMLAAAPHDTPALNSVQNVDSVADRWIPVSERMPEVGVKVLCFPAEDEPIHAVFNGQLWMQDVSWSGSEEPIDNVIPVTVTHWMPLPAGPQEVR